MRNLRGKRVLITGAAQGIGLALALRFAREGAEVLATDLDPEALPVAAEAIRAVGGRASTHALDVTDPAAIQQVRERIHEEGGPVDLLVNNAGVVFGGPLLDVPWDRHRLTYEVNVLGLVGMTRTFLPDLIGRSEAHLVNIASASGLIGLPYGTTYASSKWAVIGFGESVKLELKLLGHRHVGVTTACPSYVSTGLFTGAKPPLTTRMLTPGRLADRVVHAVKKNRSWVLTPWLVKLTPPLKGLLPSGLFERVAWMLGVSSSMVDWKGHR